MNSSITNELCLQGKFMIKSYLVPMSTKGLFAVDKANLNVSRPNGLKK